MLNLQSFLGSRVAPVGMTRPQAANYLGISPKTLADWASKGFGPPFVKLGGRAVYPLEEFKNWLDRQPRRNASNASVRCDGADHDVNP